MDGDADDLPSTSIHQKRSKASDELTKSAASRKRVPGDMEIEEYFKLRLETHKTWAYCIARKRCSEILIDGFKSDLSNDFTLMINWLALTNKESLSLLEAACNGDDGMELDVALQMVFRMVVPLEQSNGPTCDAFRELIAVLCGGTQGNIPQLDVFANFTEWPNELYGLLAYLTLDEDGEKATRFIDQAAADVIVRLVKEIFKLTDDVKPPMDKCSASPLSASLRSPQAMRNVEPPCFEQKDEVNGTVNTASESPRERLPSVDGSLPTIVAHCEGPSVSNNSDEELKSSTSNQPEDSTLVRPLYSKTRRDIYAIRSRKAGRARSYSDLGTCFVCGKKDAGLRQCGKKYSSSSYCSTSFHAKCIEDYNAAEYSVDCLRKIVDETLCPLHFCSTCYLERWKTTAVRGSLVECDSCFRAFHEQCVPAGFEPYEDVAIARTREGSEVEVRQYFTRCHSHCDYKLHPLIPNTRSHLPFCCECENAGDEPLVKCSRCVRSFHEGCLTLTCRDLGDSDSSPICESCVLGETLRTGQPVIAKFRGAFYAATITKLEDYPKHCLKVDKYGKFFNEPGYLCVQWAGCERLYALLPARDVVAMFAGSFDLIGKRVRELPCREAWQVMEQDLAVPRPTFDYIPDKYTKIKTSVYHPSCPKPRLDGCDETDSMCDCPPDESDRCGPSTKCQNRAILQECPEACEAVPGGCNNRGVSRKEVNPAVEIREAPGKGMGAFATRDIPKGAFIAEYAGELISNEEKSRRVAEMAAHRNAEEKHYMMALDSQRFIDCKEKGNDARFLNHSCSPNCKVETVYVVVSRTKRPNGYLVKYDKRIMIYTIEDVPAGTELCFNYQMMQYNLGCPLPDCKCGAPNCTGTLGSTSVAAQDRQEGAEFEVSPVAVPGRKRKKQPRISDVLHEPPGKKIRSRPRKSVTGSMEPTEAKSKLKTESNGEPKAESKGELKADAKCDLEAEAKSESKVATKSEPKAEVPGRPKSLTITTKKGQRSVANGRVSRPTLTFKRTSICNGNDATQKVKRESSPTRRPRRPKTLNGLKDHSPQNRSRCNGFKVALLKGEALEKLSSASSQKATECVNGLKRVHQVAVDVTSANVVQ